VIPDPKRLSAVLMATAGALFLVAGALRGFRQPVWLLLGATFLAIGVVMLRGSGKP
jgi:hypothetical protein